MTRFFPNISLTIPWLLTTSLTFPWHVSNSLTFPGFPDKWSPCKLPHYQFKTRKRGWAPTVRSESCEMAIGRFTFAFYQTATCNFHTETMVSIVYHLAGIQQQTLLELDQNRAQFSNYCRCTTPFQLLHFSTTTDLNYRNKPTLTSPELDQSSLRTSSRQKSVSMSLSWTCKHHQLLLHPRNYYTFPLLLLLPLLLQLLQSSLRTSSRQKSVSMSLSWLVDVVKVRTCSCKISSS